MLKREIKYTNFDDEEVTETFYFNLSKSELIELEVEREEGMSEWLQAIIETKDHKELIAQFKRLVLLTYGQKSEDGKRFIKNDQLREEFSQTPAYDALFMELALDDGAAVAFIKGIMPKDMAGDLDKKMTEITSAPAPTT